MATSPYVSQSISGYNASAPADDGSETEANRIKWSTIKTKLPDPIKTLAEAINTQLVTAFGKVINTDANENNAMAGSLAFTVSTLTLATDAATVTRSAHVIAAESGTSDDCATLTATSVSSGCLLFVQADTGDTITMKDGTGNLDLGSDFVLPTDRWTVLRWNGTNWQMAGPPVATQAQMETPTSAENIVTPGRVQYHPGVAKAWVLFSGAGTPAVTVSHNLDAVTPLVDNAAGDYTINVATDFSTANWCAVGMCEDTGVGSATIWISEAAAPTAGSIRIFCAVATSAAALDSARICVAMYGDQ